MAAKSLILVENSYKARTLKKLFGSAYSILSTDGFIKALPKSRLGIDEENNYTASYKTVRGKGPIFQDLKKETLDAGLIFIASSPTLEGEFFANQCCELFGINKKSRCRIVFDELTKTTAKILIQKARPINMNLVNAYEAKLIIDKIASHKIGEYLSYKIWRGNKVGRFRDMLLKIIAKGQPAGTFEISQKLNFATLQELAARDLNFAASKTTLTATQLYEGVNCGKEGHFGLIKFPADEIELTTEKRTPESVKEFLNDSQFKLYELIYNAINNGFSTKVELDGTNTNLALMIALDNLKVDWAKYFSLGMLSLVKRQYIEVKDSVYTITDWGKKILSSLGNFFEEDFSAETYNNVTAQIKKISEGAVEKLSVIDDYCKHFNKSFENAMASLPEGAEIKEVPVVETDEICDKCGGKMVLRYGKYGRFLACSNYPECRNIKPYFERTNKKCPKCGSNLTKRLFKSGLSFYTCENPECNFRTWDEPLEKPCKVCGSTVFIHKFRGRPSMIYCGNDNCETRIGHPMNKVLLDIEEKVKKRQKKTKD